nr:alpha/beta fold hydrolase [Streptomyces sp. SID13031]
MICIPYAGGDVRAFRNWPAALPSVGVHIAQLPGRGRNSAKPLPRSIGEVVDDLSAAVDALPDGNLVIFGHSLGALIGFDLALRLERSGRAVDRFFASGCSAPGTPRIGYHHHTDTEFLNLLRTLGATPREFFDEPELQDFYLPVLRSDFRLAYDYRPDRDHVLTCPIDVLYGEDDGDTPLASADGWRSRSTGTVTFTPFPGGHFFQDQFEEPILRRLATVLSPDHAELQEWSNR